MASVVGSSYVSQELIAILVFFLKYFKNEPTPVKSRFFYV